MKNSINRTARALMMQNELLKPSLIWALYLFFGWSYGAMGKMGMQILFYLTLGGFGVWAITRLFTLNRSINKYNNAIYIKYGVNFCK